MAGTAMKVFVWISGLCEKKYIKKYLGADEIIKTVLCSSKNTYSQDPYSEHPFQHVYIIIAVSGVSQRTP